MLSGRTLSCDLVLDGMERDDESLRGTNQLILVESTVTGHERCKHGCQLGHAVALVHIRSLDLRTTHVTEAHLGSALIPLVGDR